jgi:polyisoprenoid-binding protein YceI
MPTGLPGSLSARWSFLTISGLWLRSKLQVARYCFVAKTSINRQEFGVSWNDKMDKGGIVVSNFVEITIDAEAILVASD